MKPVPQAGAPRQLLLDLSVLVHKDDRSGIQRVVRNLLQALLQSPPAGFEVRPVHDAGGHYVYAEAAAQGRYLPGTQALHVRPGDIFLGLDLCPDQVPANRAVLDDLRRHGVQLFFVVYDLLPVLQPDVFAPGASAWFGRWLETVGSVADGLLCISRAVADDLRGWLEQARLHNPGVLQLGYFHLGSDLGNEAGADLNEPDLGEAEQQVLAVLATRPAFLMVGTLEPRKMQAQALDAFELLWRDGCEATLVVLGKPGWLTTALEQRLRQHGQLGRRLFWLPDASDAALQRLYRDCAALLAASLAEGFGLPLVEAARFGLPIVARDIAVFREVCGDHAYYFSGDSVELAAALRRWLRLSASGQAPRSADIGPLDWAASGAQLRALIAGRNWYCQASTLLR